MSGSEAGRTAPVACALCGRVADPAVDGDPPLGWSADVGDDLRHTVRHICPTCTREHVRAIEAKLAQEWW